MNQTARRLVYVAAASILLLASCTGPAPRAPAPTATAPGAAAASPESPEAPPAGKTENAPVASHAPLRIEDTSVVTGISACDDYLASYKGCHAAAGIFSPGTIEQHYREMRDNLVKLSRDPSMRDALAARCTALANQLKKALHGKSCQVEPANAASTD